MNELERLDKELDALAAYESGKGYLHFLMHVMIDSQPERKPFRVIGESWQWERERERGRSPLTEAEVERQTQSAAGPKSRRSRHGRKRFHRLQRAGLYRATGG